MVAGIGQRLAGIADTFLFQRLLSVSADKGN